MSSPKSSAASSPADASDPIAFALAFVGELRKRSDLSHTPSLRTAVAIPKFLTARRFRKGALTARDFVEFPSQVNEMWADWPAVLKNYARHYQTGAPIPQQLLDKVIAAAKFNQGFATTEYLGAAMLDQRWHQLPANKVPAADGVLAFEASALAADGVDYAPVPPRYRTTYFSHIMGGYQAGYYSYIWSEVLDANSQDWFKAHGGLTRANGDHFRKTLLSRGGSRDALELFREFAGHEPQIGPLLEKRGLTVAQ